jgi:L-alanine-DL-glutamate epimerase-like enolase superfamily enzyme
MKISAIRTFPVALKLKKPLQIAKMLRERSSSILVKVETDEGVAGFGEATFAHFFAGETQDSAASAIRKHLAPPLIGKDPAHILPLVDEMEKAIAGNPFAKAAVEMALWDIKGKALEVPVFSLLGGARRRVIPMNASVGWGEIPEMVEEALAHVAQGFRTLKIYCGRETPQADLERIRQIRQAVGGQIQLYAEANQRWGLKAVLWMLPRLEELGVLFLEQPIASHLRREMRILRERSPIPIALDEGVFSAEDVAQAKLEGVADIVNIYVLKAGGIGNTKKALDVADAVGLDSFIGSFNELGVSSMAGAQVAATMARLPYPCYLVGPMLYEEDLLREPMDFKNGSLYLSERPGLGIEVDEEKLAKFC